MSKQKKNAEDVQEIQVTDRRRIYLDDEGQTQQAGPGPNLKPTYVEELEARTKAAEDRVLEVQSRFDQLRTQLQKETDETRQRLNRAADERAEREKADFIAGLLPVLDNLLRATEAAANTDSVEVISEGVRQTAESFEKALKVAGVEPIESVGKPFDPLMHEAVETIPVGANQDGTIIAEYTRGYRIGDRLLRPARVTVGSADKTSGHAGS